MCFNLFYTSFRTSDYFDALWILCLVLHGICFCTGQDIWDRTSSVSISLQNQIKLRSSKMEFLILRHFLFEFYQSNLRLWLNSSSWKVFTTVVMQVMALLGCVSKRLQDCHCLGWVRLSVSYSVEDPFILHAPWQLLPNVWTELAQQASYRKDTVALSGFQIPRDARS